MAQTTFRAGGDEVRVTVSISGPDWRPNAVRAWIRRARHYGAPIDAVAPASSVHRVRVGVRAGYVRVRGDWFGLTYDRTRVEFDADGDAVAGSRAELVAHRMRHRVNLSRLSAHSMPVRYEDKGGVERVLFSIGALDIDIVPQFV
jgi:hypothetical protein